MASVDREVGRLLGAGPRAPGRRIVAVAGDHGEMLGEHGEKEHGVFLYRAALEVPLILSGPGVPAGRALDGVVGTRALASTLLGLLGYEADARPFGRGLSFDNSAKGVAALPVYSESFLPATAYGWSPLRAATNDRYRLVVAPRPDSTTFWPTRGRAAISSPTGRRRPAGSGGRSPRRSGAPGPRLRRPAPPSSPNPFGVWAISRARPPGAAAWIPRTAFPCSRSPSKPGTWARQGRNREAVAKLRDLVERSPGNVPFLSRLGEAEVAVGETAAGLATFRQAIALNPELDFLHAHLARLLAGSGRPAEARAEYEAALALNPRSAPAWLGLAEIASRQGPAGEELRILLRGEAAAPTARRSLARLAQIELPAGDIVGARRHVEEAVRLAPDFAAAWWVAGEVAEKEVGRPRPSSGSKKPWRSGWRTRGRW